MKQCNKCKINKELFEFPKNKRYKSGYNSQCKICSNSNNKQYRDKNIENVKNSRKVYYQKNIIKMRKSKKDYYNTHKSEKSFYDKVYRKINSEKITNYKKQWELLHKDEPLFKIKKNLRRRVHHALSGNRKMNKTFNLIGCTPEDFKIYIENQFIENMNWDNYGEWHIDHIIPCYRFNLLLEEEQYKCFHYTNQRPLWAIDNLSRTRDT